MDTQCKEIKEIILGACRLVGIGRLNLQFKGIYAITFSSPRAQPEAVLFWYESPYFSNYNPKFQLQIHNTLEVIADNVPISGIPILIFLCIFITASSPVSHTCFCLRRENKK